MFIEDRVRKEAVRLGTTLEKMPHTGAHEYNLDAYLDRMDYLRFSFILKREDRGDIESLKDTILSAVEHEITQATIIYGTRSFQTRKSPSKKDQQTRRKGGFISETYIEITPNPELSKQEQLEIMERELKLVKNAVEDYLYGEHRIVD